MSRESDLQAAAYVQELNELWETMRRKGKSESWYNKEVRALRQSYGMVEEIPRMGEHTKVRKGKASAGEARV